MPINTLRVLVVDDSVLFRKVVSDCIEKIDIARLGGIARDGQDAIEKIENLKPDVVTLDIEMPRLNGIETLKIISERWPSIKVIMVSALTKSAIADTIEAIEESAFSFITKPESEEDSKEIGVSLKREIEAVFFELNRKGTLVKGVPRAAKILSDLKQPPLAVAIGVSTGGPKALLEVIPKLPVTLSVPVFIVQHMPAGFTASLASSLDKKSVLSVKEAVHGESARPGNVYIAPGGKHLRIQPSVTNVFGTIEIGDDAPENHCKPSVDNLYRSLSKTHPGRVCAVIMTGMGSDGTIGLKLLKRKGVFVIGQSGDTCAVYGMPASAKTAGVVDKEVPLSQIAEEIKKVVGE